MAVLQHPRSAVAATGVAAITMATMTTALVVVSGVVHVLNRTLPTDGLLLETVPLNLLDAMIWTVGGLLLARQRPRVVFGWLFLLAGWATAVTALAMSYGIGGLFRDWPLAAEVAAVAGFSVPVHIGMIAIVLLLFPTGRPVAPWAWGGVALVAGGAAAWAMGDGFAAGPLFPESTEPTIDGVANPLAIPNPFGVAAVPAWLGPLGSVALTVGEVVAGLTVILRWRGADRVQREQLLWFYWAAAFLPLAALCTVVLPEPWGFLVFKAVIGLIILALTIALVRHHLFDVHVVVARTAVYGVLTAVLAAVYLVLVTVIGALLSGSGAAPAATLVATAGVAVAFAPLRAWLQRAARRLLYGRRDEPWAVLESLDRHLEARMDPADVLQALADTVTTTLRLPWAEVRADGDLPGAESGLRPEGRRMCAVPLLDRGDRVGEVRVVPRRGEASLGAEDARLLGGLAGYAGVAVRAAVVGEDLRRSRRQLVTAGEEERRRVGRDLHDSLGAALTAVALKIDLARAVLDGAHPRADALLDELREEVAGAIEDVRRLVRDLHPPVLGRLGLAGAVREAAERLRHGPTGTGGSGLTVDVQAGDLPTLPAAVEVAAYRIAAEAMTNVARHSGAGHCVVRLSLDAADVLGLDVTDDGHGGQASWEPGVGLASMHRRAAELGGTCRIGPGVRGGTHVSVRLPLVTGTADVRAREAVPA